MTPQCWSPQRSPTSGVGYTAGSPSPLLNNGVSYTSCPLLPYIGGALEPCIASPSRADTVGLPVCTVGPSSHIVGSLGPSPSRTNRPLCCCIDGPLGPSPTGIVNPPVYIAGPLSHAVGPLKPLSLVHASAPHCRTAGPPRRIAGLPQAHAAGPLLPHWSHAGAPKPSIAGLGCHTSRTARPSSPTISVGGQG
ncbi:hypothetical protein AMTR_s00034p00222450, partial [Amborella trichopoda]